MTRGSSREVRTRQWTIISLKQLKRGSWKNFKQYIISQTKSIRTTNKKSFLITIITLLLRPQISNKRLKIVEEKHEKSLARERNLSTAQKQWVKL